MNTPVLFLSGGPDGVRTRDRPVKSRTLYLTKLQAQMYVLGFLADLYRVLKSSAIKKTTLNAVQSGSEDNLTDNPSFLLNDIKPSEKS